MFTKYEIKTYPEQESSSIEKRKKYFKSKNNPTEENTEQILETTFQPKCIFTKQNNNISFYQSSSFKNSKNKNKENDIINKNITPIMKIKNKIYKIKKSDIIRNNNNNENTLQNFSYNYNNIMTDTHRNKKKSIKNNINNINININPHTNNFNFNERNIVQNKKRINLNENNSIIKRNKKKRITKSCKRELNVQKRDDFNVLSYKQPEYDSDYNISQMNKNKIIHIYKKQGVDEIFFPSKRTHSPMIPGNRKKEGEKYQTHILKYQSFFGSYNSNKPKKMIKSSSRKTINQLKDFNIDKLMEIGDKYTNMHKPILPLGKLMNNNILCFNLNRNINKPKKNRYKIPINTYNNCFNYSKHIKNKTPNQNEDSNTYFEENKENIQINNIPKEKHRVTKKVIYKNTIKNQKNETKIYDEYTVRKYLNFRNETLKNSDMKNTNYINSSVVIRRRNMKNENNKEFIKKQNSFDKNSTLNENDTQDDGIPKKKVQKIIPKEINKKKEKEILITDVNNINSNRNIRKKLKIGDNRKILINIDVNKRYNRYNTNKTKNYYGYDDRHKLEDTVNNHAYYESLHSKKVS